MEKAECDLEANCNFADLLPKQMRRQESALIETACKYEYMRESQALRDKLNEARSTESAVERKGNAAVPFIHGKTALWGGQFRLLVALLEPGFPKPWKRLTKQAQKELVAVIGGWDENRKKSYPPVLIRAGAPELVSPGVPGLSSNVWRLVFSEPEFHWPPQSETDTCFFPAQQRRKYFYGFIRIDEDYNQTEVRAAFTAWLKGRHGKTKGGSGGWREWQAKLNDLVVMRLWHRFPKRGDAIRRVEHVAKFTTAGFNGCKDWWNDRQKAISEKREVDRRISQSASEEMSRARVDALKFFQSLFPGEKPLNY